MVYSVADCAHNKVCTTCPSRTTCDMRKLFYNEERYREMRNHAFFTAYSAANSRGFGHLDCEELAKESVAIMDHRRDEELKLHPQYSET